MNFILHEDGSFDILGRFVQLTGCYPAIEGRPLRPLSLNIGDHEVYYQLSSGALSLHFRREGGCLGIDCKVENLSGVHDISPLDHGKILYATRVFAQGYGMEGPSGDFSLGEHIPTSHGLTALHGEQGALLSWAEDHRRFSLRYSTSEQRLFSANFNLEGTGGDLIKLPTLFFKEAEDLSDGLCRCAQRIADAMNARHDKAPAFFWSSWYYVYETMDQHTLEETLDGLRSSNLPFQYVELDAGYAPSLGDWLIANHRWPGGLRLAAQTILDAGFQPGVWVAPFIVGDRSDLYREHPDWVLHDLDGNPVIQLRSYTEPKMWGNPDCDYYILDTSHPDALNYLAVVFQTLRSWGFSLFKTDFMLWNMHDSSQVRRYDPSLTSVEILRRTLDVIRTAIGEESYLLGCIAPFMPFIGYADGMRLAGDCGAQWAEPFGPVNMLHELPCDNYFNHIFWQNDPDAMLLRDFATLLTSVEVRSLALLQALSGGVVSTSDPVQRLSPERRGLLHLVAPSERCQRPRLPAFGSGRRELLLTHCLPQGNLLFVMNPSDEPLTVFYRLRELFGDADWYQYRYRWEEDQVDSVKDDLFAETLAPHDSALVFITREALREKPSNLWDW